MRKILIVARREYRAMVATKVFIITLLLMPVLMGGGVFFQEQLRRHVDLDEKRIVVFDETGVLLKPLLKAAEGRNKGEIFDFAGGGQIKPRYRLEPGPAGPVTDRQRLDASARVRRGEIHGFVEIPADVLAVSSSGSCSKAKFYAHSTAFSEEKNWLQQALNSAVRRQRLRQAEIDPDKVDRASTWVMVEGLGLFKTSGNGQVKPAAPKSEKLMIFLPFGMMMLMFMVIMLAAQPMIETVMEERSQRIAEVLLGSLSPSQWMAGKLLGCVAGSLTIVAVYGLGALGLAEHYGVLHLAPVAMVPWFLVFQVLAVVLFSSLFMALGACVNDRRESQTMQIPMMLLIVFPMFVWFNVVQQPTGRFATWISLVPPATPMLMTLRLAANPDIPPWQPVLGVLLLLATTGLCVFAAARIFRIAILTQGQLPKMKQLLRWIVTG
jgi:ABC-2 type transport system permease protein